MFDVWAENLELGLLHIINSSPLGTVKGVLLFKPPKLAGNLKQDY